MKRKTIVTVMMFAVVLMTAMADVVPPPGALETEGILKSLQSPVFLSFWLLWGGLVAISLALFFKRRFLKMAAVVFGVLILIIGLETGVKNYDCCVRCGTKLMRISVHGFYGCPKCNRHKLYGTCKECGKEFERLNRGWTFQRKEGEKDGVDLHELCNACIDLHGGHVR